MSSKLLETFSEVEIATFIVVFILLVRKYGLKFLELRDFWYVFCTALKTPWKKESNAFLVFDYSLSFYSIELFFYIYLMSCLSCSSAVFSAIFFNSSLYITLTFSSSLSTIQLWINSWGFIPQYSRYPTDSVHFSKLIFISDEDYSYFRMLRYC